MFEIEATWIGANKLNPNGRSYKSNLEGIGGYDYYERYHKGDNWWTEMKKRMNNKTEEQKDLDRRLVEAVGHSWFKNENGKEVKPEINIEEVRKLGEMGATIDHWVERDGYEDRYTAIQLAAWNGSDEATEVLLYLEQKFDFNQKDNRGGDSSFAISMVDGFQKMSIALLKTKKPENPIFSFLYWSFKQTEDEKIELLEKMNETYNFSTLMKKDLRQIQNENRFNYSYVRANLEILFKFCRSKKMNLENVFGKSYEIDEPISWRYKNGKDFHWVAEEIQKMFKNGKVDIENSNGTIQVKIAILRFEFILF